MHLLTYCFAVLFLFLALCQPVIAAGYNCFFSKSVHRGATTFDVSSRPAIGCAVQVVTVGVRRSGRLISVVKSDVDYLTQSARSADLTGDGRPELLVFSLTAGEVTSEVLDVYWLDGFTLRRFTVPELDQTGGYRGGDRFHLEGRLIVRTIPVFLDDDPAGNPGGGSRTFRYELKNGALSPYIKAENSGERATDSSEQRTPVTRPAAPAETGSATAARLVISSITAGETGIEISANGAVEKYRTMRLDKPERIAIDIPGADSPLAGKRIAINRFGISTVRVGRNKGFLRIVLDSPLKVFPKQTVTSSGTALQIEFAH